MEEHGEKCSRQPSHSQRLQYQVTHYATNECQDIASKFKERVTQSLARLMDVYDRSFQDVQRYLQWPEINFRDEHPISFALYQEIKEKYDMTKAKVQVKEVISKYDIQEFLVKPSKEFSHYATFVHKFMVEMEKFKECNLTLDVKKEHIFNSWEKRVLIQHEAWNRHFQSKGG